MVFSEHSKELYILIKTKYYLVKNIKKDMYLTIIFILLLSISLLFNTECTAYTNSFVISDNTPCYDYLLIKAIDNSTGKEIQDVNLTIEIIYDPPYENLSHLRWFWVNLSKPICFGMPSSFFSTRAVITIKVNGYYDTEPVVIYSSDYWSPFEIDINATDFNRYHLKHTFYLDPIDNNCSKILDNNINSDENIPGFVLPLLVSALIVVILLEKRKL